MKKKTAIGIAIVLVLVLGIYAVMKMNDSKEKAIPEKQAQETSEKFVKVLADGKRVNISEKLKEEKTLDNMKVKNLELVTKGKQTKLTAVIENNSNKTKGDYSINAIAKDEQGKELRKVLGYVNNVKSGQTTKLVIKASSDFVNAYDIVFEKTKKK